MKKKNVFVLFWVFSIMFLLAGCSTNSITPDDKSDNIWIENLTGNMMRNWQRRWSFWSGNMILHPEDFRWTGERPETPQWWPRWDDLFMSGWNMPSWDMMERPPMPEEIE